MQILYSKFFRQESFTQFLTVLQLKATSINRNQQIKITDNHSSLCVKWWWLR